MKYLPLHGGTTEEATPKLALSSEVEGMYGQIKKLLAQIGFLNPENPDYWMMHLRRFFTRARLLSREVKIIRGICRQVGMVCPPQKNLTLPGSSHRCIAAYQIVWQYFLG